MKKADFPIAPPFTGYIGIALSALSALKGMKDAEDFKRWEKDIEEKLDVIIFKLDEILHLLRTWFPEALDDEVRKIWSTMIDANRITLNEIIVGLNGGKPSKTEIRDRLSPLLNNQRQTTLLLCNYERWGFTHYHEVLIGVITSIALMKLIGVRQGEIAAFAKDVKEKYFEPSLDPKINAAFTNNRLISFAAKKVELNESKVLTESYLNSTFNRWWNIGSRIPPAGVSGFGFLFVFIHGNTQEGRKKVDWWMNPNFGDIKYPCPPPPPPFYLSPRQNDHPLADPNYDIDAWFASLQQIVQDQSVMDSIISDCKKASDSLLF